MPQQFTADELYQLPAGSSQQSYGLRGLIVFSQNHYLAYVLQDFSEEPASSAKDDRSSTRWVRFNDESVRVVPGGWNEVIAECLTMQAYPTVLVFDKLSKVQ